MSIVRVLPYAVVAAMSISFASAPIAGAASGGDPNAGDVWLDNVGQPPGPGHEMDPHLTCSNINLWGAKLADSSGSYSIDGWPPSGKQEIDYSSTWSYNTSQGGDQVISVIDVQKLVAQAAANGDKPAAQGYHFKLDFSQDPQKHKTFWVNCPPPSSSSTGSPSTTGTSAPSGTSPSSGSSSPTTSRPGAKRRASIRSRHHRHRKHKRAVRAKRISRPPRVSSGFTG
jgi:hypothetical protein